MITVFRGSQVYALKDLKPAMLTQLKQLPRMVSTIGSLETIYRFEYDCEPLNILAWLHNQSAADRVYWSHRDGDFETAGVHLADVIEGRGTIDYAQVFNQIQDRIGSDNQQLQYLGGFCFDTDSMGEQWSDFGSYRFIVPEFECTRRKDRTSIAFNIRVDEINEDAIAAAIQHLDGLSFEASTRYRKVPCMTSREDTPDLAKWTSNVRQAQESAFDKLVLARRSTFGFDMTIRPDALIKFLKDRTPNCYHFNFQLSDYHGFLGASPERLCRIEDGMLNTEAVAGTVAADDAAQQNQQLEQELLDTDKLRDEHQFVVGYLDEQMRQLCREYKKADRPGLMKLKNTVHLRTPFEGRLRPDCPMDEVLSKLHPTPAVGGYPAKGVPSAIRSIEAFDRGWYAGPVGCVGYDWCEFAVAIRSGLVRDDTLSLFAGAGIVKDSVASDEWDEIENKISRFMRVFEHGK